MMSHEETLHVSTTACMEQNISTQASMLCVNSVQETETPNTQVENHQTDSSAGPASTILSTMSSMKLRDIMDKMTSCLFGWSWRQVSLFNLTGKDTATVKPTVHIPCTAIVPVRGQELFVPCSLLEDTVSCNQEVEESVAVSPQSSLAELELRIHLTQICDITARLCVVFRPECIVEVDCSILNFEAIADGMRRIGLPQPTRSTAVTLAIMPHQTSAVQQADTSGDQPDECDDHEIALDVSLLEDTTSYNQVEVVELVANAPQSRGAHLELRLQFPGICDITAHLCVVFRRDGIVEVEVSILRFVAFADDIREIDFQLPIESILNSAEFMSLQQVALTSKVQPVYYDNHEMSLDITHHQTQQLYDHEFQAVDCLNSDTATDNTATILDHDITAYVPCDNYAIPIEAPRWSQIAENVYHDAIATIPIEDDQEAMVTETSNLPEDTLEARVADNEQKAVESMSSVSQPRQAELELCLQFPGICDITARVYVVFRPEGIADVYVSILNFVAIADDIREIDFQLPIESILSSPEFMSLQQVALMSEVQPVYYDNHEMSLDVTRQQTQPLDHEFQAAVRLNPDTTTDNTTTTLDHHDVMANQLQESLKVPQYVACDNHKIPIETPRWSQIAENVYHDAIATIPIEDDQEAMVTETSNLPEDTLEARVADNEQKAVESMSSVPQPSPAELELQLQLPGICDITARVYVVFRPEGIAEVEVSILNFVAIADDIREIDFQLPIKSILSSPEFMSLQQVALITEVQPVYYDNYEMELDVTRQQTQHLYDHDFQAASCLNPDTATDNTATTLDHDITAYVPCDNYAIPIEAPRWSQIAENEYHDAIATIPIVDDQEVMVTETSNLPEDTLEARVADNEQKAVESMSSVPQPSPVELELQLQLPGICDITARVYVVFRPEGIADVYVSILNFVAIADDIREIDFQLPIESILSSPEFMSLQQVAVTSKVQPVDCVTNEMALELPQGEDHVQHSFVPAPTTANEAETINNERSSHDVIQPTSEAVVSKDLKGSEIFFGKVVQREKENPAVAEKVVLSGKDVPTISDDHSSTCNSTTSDRSDGLDELCSRLASIDTSLPVSESTSCKTKVDFKGLEVFFGKTIKSENNNSGAKRAVSEKVLPTPAEPVRESEEVAPVESSEESKPMDDVTDQSVEYQQTTVEGVPSRSTTFVSAQCDLEQQQQGTVNVTLGLPSEGIQLQKVSAVVPVNYVQEKITKEETVTECTRSSPSVEELQQPVNVAVPSEEQLSGSVEALCHALPTIDAQPTNNALAELVTRGIKEIRKSVDATGRGIENVPLEGSTEKRSRKRSHAEESNQLLYKDIEVEKTEAESLSTPSLEDIVEEKKDSQLVTHRYPSDVHQALLTQTVDLLERGIELLSDDGSFKAFVSPSSACRIGWALTDDNFSRYFKRYNDDVLPQDLKQKVIERAAVVAMEHQDRAFERIAERPIFTLSEIRHYDCNGDYIMEDVSSPNTPVYPFTGIHPRTVHQCFVNPFQSGIAPQGLLTSGLHNPFHTMQQYQYTVDDIEMIDADEVYMDIDESFEDVFMECEDQTDCPSCSQISLNLFASLPTKYAISRRAIYSLLDERPLNPEIPSWRVKKGSKKSWFAYNTFSFRPEFDELSGGLSRKDRVIYSVLDERPLNPVLSPSLIRQSNMKSWFAYNTFSFKEGDLVPIGSNYKCNCMQTQNSFQAASQAANPVSSKVEPWPKLEQNTIASKSPFNTFSFSFADHNSQQASIFGEIKQESVFSFEKAEEPVPSTDQPVTVSSGVSWKDFSFREEDDPKHVALFGESKQSFTSSLLQAEENESHDTTKQPTDLSFEPAVQAVDEKTSTFAFGEEEQPAFPVSDDSGSIGSETESDEDSFDLNDENDELVVKEIIDAVKSKHKERNLPESEEPSNTTVETESVKDNETPSEVESVTNQGFVVDEQKDELKNTSEAKYEVDRSLMNGMAQSQAATKYISQDASQTAEQNPTSKLAIPHSKSISKRTEPYPTQAGSGLAAYLRRRVKVIEHDRLKSLQVSTQLSQVEKDEDLSNPVPVLPENVQQRRVVSLKSLTGNTKTYPSSKHDLSITIAPSDEEDRKVVSSKSLSEKTKTYPSNKHDLSITIAPSDEEDSKEVCLKSLTHDKKPDSPTSSSIAVTPVVQSLSEKTITYPSTKHDLSITIAPSDEEDSKEVCLKSLTHDKKPDSPTSSSIAVTPVVQSDVKTSNKKVSLKSLHQTKKEPDVKGSEMERLMSRAQRKDSDAFISKSTPYHSKSADARTANNIKRVPFAQSDRTEPETSTYEFQPTVSSVAEKRGKLISLRSVIQSKKAEPTSKSSSPETHRETIQGSGQISKPAPEEGSSQLASLKSPTLMPKVDSMSNSIPHLPLVSTDAENNEVLSLNPLPEGRNTEASSKTIHSVASALSGVQKTKVVSLTSLTQGTCKKDERVRNAVAIKPQLSSGMKDSKESHDVIKTKFVSLKLKTQCAEMDLDAMKEPTSYASHVSSKIENSDKKDLLKPLEQPETEHPFNDSSPSKSLPAVEVKESRMVSLKSLTGGWKSEQLSTTAVSSPQVSTVAESNAKKVTFKKIDVKGKESASYKCSSKVQASKEKNAKVVAMKTALEGSFVAETGSAIKVAFSLTHEGLKEDALIKSSVSTADVSLDNAEVVSLKEEPNVSFVAESSCARAVPFTSKLQKKDALKMSSAETASELMSFKSTVKSEEAVPVNTSRVPSKVGNNVASLEALVRPTNAADVKSNGSAREHDQQRVSESYNCVKPKSFQSRTSSHKRELDEMLEEDQLSDMERLRKFNSRRRNPSSGKPRKANVKTKSVGNSCDVDNNKNSEANVKLVKTAAVEDTSIAKRSSVTTKQLKPISLAVDVNIVKDAKNESNAKWIPGTLEKIKPSPEGRVAVADVPKSTSSIEFGQGTSQESNLTPLAAVKTDDLNATSSSAVQSSPATLNPNPIPPAEVAEVKLANTVDMNIVQSSRSTIQTKVEPSPRNDTETIGKDPSSTAESNKTRDSSEKSGLHKPEESSSSMDLIKEPLCLAGVVAISGENVINERISEPPLAPVPQPAAENVTLGKRKLEAMENEDEEIPTVKTEKTVEVKKKRRWGPAEKTPENHEQQNKPRRIVRNKFKKA